MDSQAILPFHKEEFFLDRPIYSKIIFFLIIYSVICFSIETLPDISASMSRFLFYSEIFTVIIFSIEYLIRVLYAERKLRFIFSFYGIIDLLAILPFYLALGMDLRNLRLLRLFRLIRILKLVRYNSAIARFSRAIYLAKDELVVFSLSSILLLYLAAVGIYHFEHEAQPDVFKSIFDCLWWSVATLTTVGYGDIYPITIGGRLFTFATLMIGLGLVAVPTGIVASALSSVREQEKSTGFEHDIRQQ